MAAERPDYAILGRGRWAVKMRSILEAQGRRVTCIESTRKDPAESQDSYTARLASMLRDSGARIAWLCVAPGAHVACMISAAIDAGVHTVAEKPWVIPARETEALTALARRRGIALGVHFEYCLLDEIEAWRERFEGGRGLQFNGRFAVSRADRLEIPAALNLGCHLLAIRRYAVPQAAIAEISCAYQSDEERKVWTGTDSIDFTHNRQPIVQRFIQRFEAAIEGAEFPFGIGFALRVTEDVITCPGLRTTASRRP